jgi:hypothetical protein
MLELKEPRPSRIQSPLQETRQQARTMMVQSVDLHIATVTGNQPLSDAAQDVPCQRGLPKKTLKGKAPTKGRMAGAKCCVQIARGEAYLFSMGYERRCESSYRDARWRWRKSTAPFIHGGVDLYCSSVSRPWLSARSQEHGIGKGKCALCKGEKSENVL